jgi:hypothetical protein
MIINTDNPAHFNENGWNVDVAAHGMDDKGVFRLIATSPEWNIELFPSKGLSIGQAYFKDQPIFWEAPTGLIHPDKFDPNESDVLINGIPAPGFSFLKTFASGIELYGLRNWGMPVMDDKGNLLPLHGETSNIPVDEVSIDTEDGVMKIEATYTYRTFDGSTSLPWYKRGEELFKVTRTVRVYNTSRISIDDTIENTSTLILCPDWGYHITFHAVNGAKLLIPSRNAKPRGGGDLPADIETWQPAIDESVRTEVGIIHKGLKQFINQKGAWNKCLVTYPNRNALMVTFTPAPYTQTWFCNGGANSKEFTYKNGQPLFAKPWDGLGIEIGTSALDHDGNNDETIGYHHNRFPGEKQRIQIEIEIIDPQRRAQLETEISKFNGKKELN